MTATVENKTLAGYADVDPRTLIVETNVRAEVGLDAQFLASLREHGVLMPVLVHRTPEGLRVRAGQRRTLGAVEAGLTTVPVRIVDGDEDQVRRIMEQMAENDDRADMTDLDRAAAYQQLSLLGVSAAQIAKKRGVSKAAVEAGIVTAGSKAAQDAVNDHGIDLEDAAVFAEFEGDDEATERLARVAGWNRDLAHEAQRIRDERIEAEKVAKVREDLTAQGVTITHQPGYWDTLVKALDELRAKGSKDALTAETHATCPGHAAYVNKDDEPVAVFVCKDYKAHGHLRIAAPANPDAPAKTPMSEEARAERRRVIENNKAWRSAEKVRRAWLATFAKRKTAPKDAPALIATALCHQTAMLDKEGSQGGHHMAASWLGVASKNRLGDRAAIADALAKATPARVQHIALVLVLAAYEARTGTHTWRNEGSERAYLTALETWGYPLSEVEQIARGPVKNQTPKK